MKPLFVALGALAMISAVPAAAHPKLLSSAPAAGTAVAAPATLSLRFSEKLAPAFSGARLFMTGMGGKPHAPMAMATAKPAFGADGRTMTIKPAAPLPAGAYRLDWFTVGADTHRVTGSVAFTVS